MDAEEQKTHLVSGEESLRCSKCGLTLARGERVCPNDGTEVPVDALVGSQMSAKFKFIEILGQGGMSAVYKAEDPILGRTVAVKLLNHQLISNPVMLKRFRQEGRAISRLNHTGIVRVHEFATLEHGQPCIVMDYVPGNTLASVLRSNGPLPLNESLNIFRQIAEALDHAHQHGVLHRDLKPSNVMVEKTEDGNWRVTLVDFGIAKIAQAATDGRLTSTGEIIGSPMYMSPEQCQGMQIDERSDLYSLGCLMYEALSGKAMYEFQSPIELIFKQVNAEPVPLNQACAEHRVPEPLERLVEKLIAKSPDQRFQNTRELLRALNEIDPAQAPPRRAIHFSGSKWMPVTIGLVAALTVVAGGMLYYYQNPTISQTSPSGKTPPGKSKTFTSLTDAQLAAFVKTSPAADDLDLTGRDVTDVGLTYVGELKHLRKLVLNDTRVTKLDPIAQNTDLQELYFAKTGVTDSSLAPICKLHLSKLGFSDDDITDAGMMQLSRISTLATIYASGTKLTDDCAPAFKGLKQLNYLDLDNTAIGDKVLSEINPDVEWLSIANTKITDRGLRQLPRLHALKGLFLGNSKITADGLMYVARIDKLRELTINHELTDAGLNAIANLGFLADLNVSDSRITDTGLEALSKLKTLTTLEIARTDISDRGVLLLARLPLLETLNLSGCASLTDQAVDSLLKMDRLSTLVIGGPKLTAGGLTRLKALTSLRRLELRGMRITKTQLVSLRAALPRCEVLIN